MHSKSLNVVNSTKVDFIHSLVNPNSTYHLKPHSAQPKTRQPQNGNDCQPQQESDNYTAGSELPSVVQDSQDLPYIDPCHLNPIPTNVVPIKYIMSTQGDLELPGGTQLISQSAYDSLLEKSRCARQEYHDVETETERTYEEGEEGHVDLTSSFLTRDGPAEDIMDIDPTDFSPVQSQKQLTQFPESQRFKTPATAGKKRTYRGDIIETPAPVRNPLARDDRVTPNGILGLSQAFAATQAASSPLSHGLPTGPRSDRPSPNITLQARPTSATSSSPSLRPITDLRRAVTEPASRYVPTKLSQAERERQEKDGMLQNMDKTDVFSDDFEAEDSLVVRRRRQREREERARDEFKTLSSPILHAKGLSTSSPIRPPESEARDGRYTRSLPTASPTPSEDVDLDNATADPTSEAETEQPELGSLRPSKFLADDICDKENSSVLVPKTGPRHSLSVNRDLTQVDASPSLRYTHQAPIIPLDTELHSSGPFRIMDSQPSQNKPRYLSQTKGRPSSASDIVDFVDQSPSSTAVRDSDQRVGIAKQQLMRGFNSQSGTSASPNRSEVVLHENTIPETNSEARTGITNVRTMHILESAGTVETSTEYETAVTHPEITTDPSPSQVSSPIRTTPPGRKRRKMLEISAEASPQRSQSQFGFDPEAILQLDNDEGAAVLFQSSPLRQVQTNSKKSYEQISMGKFEVSTMPLSERTHSSNVHDRMEVDEHVNDTIVAATTPELSQEIVRPGRLNRSQYLAAESERMPITTAAISSPVSRRSIFDIQASPEQPVFRRPERQIPKSNADSAKRKKAFKSAKRESRMEKRLQLDASDTTAAVNLAIEPCGQIEVQNEITQEPKPDDPSAIVVEEVTAPHMVFAYYKGDPRGYYPAKLLSSLNNGGYQIQWEGYAPDEIDSYGIKALDLRIGDVVKILAQGYRKIPYIIEGFKDRTTDAADAVTDIRGYRTLIVIPKQRKDQSNNAKTKQDIPVSSIYLDVNMWAQLKNRNQPFKPLEASVNTSRIATPLGRASTPSTPSTKGRRQTAMHLPVSIPSTGMFQNMAFAVSYDDPAQRNLVSDLVQSNGGMMIHDSFHDLLEPDITLKPQYTNIGFTALLTDKHSRKEKYMQALALGLPCLSGKWVEACIKHEKVLEWQSYLLPAGESIELDNATRSRILPPIDIHNVRLSDLLSSRMKLLGDADVGVVVGRGKAEAKRAPYLFLIHALGANHVHKVPDLKSVQELLASSEGRKVQWAFVDDKDVHVLQDLLNDGNDGRKGKGGAGHRQDSAGDCRIAGNELIVQSLILGRLYEG